MALAQPALQTPCCFMRLHVHSAALLDDKNHSNKNNNDAAFCLKPIPKRYIEIKSQWSIAFF